MSVSSIGQLYSLPSSVFSSTKAEQSGDFASLIDDQDSGGKSGRSSKAPAEAIVVGSQSDEKAKLDAALKELHDYFKKTPIERLEDKWLESHHLTREELAAKPPEEREAIMKEMADYIKKQLMQDQQDKAASEDATSAI